MFSKGETISQEEFEAYITANRITDEDFNKISKKILDLESLAFEQGSHFMNVNTCTLPENSKKISYKGYEEVFVPATKHKNLAAQRDVKTMPEWA